MRVLGLDLGTKTVGVAISDKTNTIASSLKVINFDESTYEDMLDEICQIIKKYGITHIALGLPKNMDNSLVTIELIDERLSTKEAENILITADLSRKKRKKVIDSLAATIILDTYLKVKGNK